MSLGDPGKPNNEVQVIRHSLSYKASELDTTKSTKSTKKNLKIIGMDSA
jgi:hypothetical protein